jgi:hypothetical protein
VDFAAKRPRNCQALYLEAYQGLESRKRIVVPYTIKAVCPKPKHFPSKMARPPSKSKAPRKGPAPKTSPRQINFDYIKTNSFRSFHADGVWGGLNGQLDIIMAFYSERPAIPQRVAHSIEGDRLGQEIESERVVRDAQIRDVEIAISMNVQVAKSFRDWLTEKIETVEKLRKQTTIGQ